MKWLRRHLQAARRRRKLRRFVDGLEFLGPADREKFREIVYFFDGKSLSSWEEQAHLFLLATLVPENGTIVEVGSWIGHGTCLLASGGRGPSARVFAVDTFDNTTKNSWEKAGLADFLRKVDRDLTQREQFDRNLRRFEVQDRVTPIPFLSDEAIHHLPLKSGSVDLLFVDGGHSLEVVRKDIELYVPLVKAGGTVAFHDFDTGHVGVTQAVWEAVLRGTFPTYVRKRGSLLILQKGQE
jgi:predicted O-methyltransferase YrrM